MAIHRTLNTNYVLTSFGIGFLACYVAIGLCEQLRSSYIHGERKNWRVRGKWMLFIGMAMGGAGMFCMHFIGMCALNLSIEETGQKVEIGYNLGTTIASLVVGVFAVILGTTIASEDDLFAKTKAEIIDNFISHAGKKFSMTKIKKIKDSEIIRIISTRKLWPLIVGGIIAGGGKSAMHYMGMVAIEFEGDIEIEWYPAMVFLSLCLAIGGAVLAYWMLFRLLSIFPSREILRIISSFTLTTGLGMSHYLGMYAANYKYKPGHPGNITKDHINTIDIIPVVLSAMVVLWFLSMLNFYDLRRLVYRYRNFIQAHVKQETGNNSYAGFASLFERMSDMYQPSHLKMTTSVGINYQKRHSNRNSISSLNKLNNTVVPINTGSFAGSFSRDDDYDNKSKTPTSNQINKLTTIPQDVHDFDEKDEEDDIENHFHQFASKKIIQPSETSQGSMQSYETFDYAI